jgi:hypothetical protein
MKQVWCLLVLQEYIFCSVLKTKKKNRSSREGGKKWFYFQTTERKFSQDFQTYYLPDSFFLFVRQNKFNRTL